MLIYISFPKLMGVKKEKELNTTISTINKTDKNGKRWLV